VDCSIDFRIKSLTLDQIRLKLQIWDTAGQERFKTLSTSYYRGVHGVIVVYDVTDEQSFLNVRSWIENIYKYSRPDVSMVLVGNKSDLDSIRIVSSRRGLELADEFRIGFFETSAKDNINVNEAFACLIQEVKNRVIDDCISASFAHDCHVDVDSEEKAPKATSSCF